MEPWAVAWDGEFRTTDERFGYHRCRACNALSIFPVPADRLAAIYPPNYNDNLVKGGPVAAIKLWLDRLTLGKLLASIPGRELRALDIGGGYGLQLDLVRRLDPRFSETWVADIDTTARAAAEAKGHRYFLGRVEDFEFERPFDLILMLNLIEHVADPLAVLQAAFRMLAPGGVVLLKTPNYDSLDARIFRHRNWSGYHCPRHWVLFDRAALQRQIQRAGLVVRSFSYTQGAPFWAQSVITNLAELGLLKITQERPSNVHPLFGPLAAAFAGLDFLRRPFAKTSQMFLALEKPSGSAGIGG